MLYLDILKDKFNKSILSRFKPIYYFTYNTPNGDIDIYYTRGYAFNIGVKIDGKFESLGFFYKTIYINEIISDLDNQREEFFIFLK